MDSDSIQSLSEMINNDLVIDITIMHDVNYTVHVFLMDTADLFGIGDSLPDAIQQVYMKFKKELIKHRN